MEGKLGPLRKRAMIYLWRAQQSGAIISITLLGTLTAASLYRDYLKEFFNNYGFPDSYEALGLLITMAIIFLGVFGVGFAFDRLKFWKEQNIVAIERNPYGSYKFTAKEIQITRLYMAAVMAGNPTPEQKKTVEFFDQWLKRCLEDDPVLKQEMEAVERWVATKDESIKRLLEEAT